MLRWIVLFALAAVLARLLGRGLGPLAGLRRTPRPERPAATRSRGALVPCDACGVLIEEGRAVEGEGLVFCSPSCAGRSRDGRGLASGR